ncbi:NupC/NupG family nucleoside CNT transporter [Sandarakinorhabdus limnophila]|uniref:NupC/NupG family nucleoside CNT transporter n=1 Tax=Sandarakinorhabdus limnophila TaxID=210512 RepID=UPI0026F2B1D4|nr:nucleoside transporter C-terminal domain-containing protein [Sandarakinorhabdus limnophila]MCM0032958.1 nucleoside:proton symporter [Sandarakinorhabdus limnophila]
MQQFQGLIGLAAILLLAWAFSEDRANRPGWRWLGGALLLQLAIAVIVVRVPPIWAAVGVANQGVAAIEKATLVGSSYMFGYLGGAPLPFALAQGASPPLIIAFQILPLIIVFSALSALLWHWGILKALVRGLSWALRRTLGVSGVVGLGGGGTLFLGVVESPLVLRAWFATMSRSDLFAIMAMIMATISGAILVLYASTLGKVIPNAAGHLIVASLISLPAALMVARLMVPGQPQSSEAAEPDLAYDGAMDAVVRGAMEGVQLMLAVIGIIITIFALVNLADQILALAPHVDGAALTLKRMFGWIFSPFMWAIGVPWDQAPAAGALMGTKAILNEYVAYLDLAALPAGTLAPRSALIVTYALAGFANLASIGLLVSTIASLCPQRRAEAAGLGVKSWIAGNLATLMTGAMIGLVTPHV